MMSLLITSSTHHAIHLKMAASLLALTLLNSVARMHAPCASYTRPPRPPRRGTAPLARDGDVLRGAGLSPSLPAGGGVWIRYFYEGSTAQQGRICRCFPADAHAARGVEILRALLADGVDLAEFFASAYETSTGGWLPFLREAREARDDAAIEALEDVRFPLPGPGEGPPRVDVKLSRRSDGRAPTSGRLAPGGYHAIGVVNAKQHYNVGTLWRSAYQLGANFVFTVGARYKNAPTDTVDAPKRMPLFELDDWNGFVQFAPRGAIWVAVEMGGTPLEDFVHPRNAIYILGSEDAGLPKAVLSACHHVVSLSCERYASYNVATAGALVMYDRKLTDSNLLVPVLLT
ncbi:hypothetical protein AB1Y20_001825 [Prymnesium parvum]|uniref:tRNA/rRNA methyltransferase SpoU type domain-containing protein n=1 Tax=Prymnesium parvum TaxID=97485 RepID=A0AB34KEA0_PRYPA